VFGTAAISLLSDGLRAAASAAQLTAPATDADPATALQGLDSLVASASRLTDTAATALAAQTGAVVSARALPPSATFSQVDGVLVSQDLVRAKALAGPVAVQAQPEHTTPTVLQPATSSAVLGAGVTAVPHASVALVQAAQVQRAAAPPLGHPVAVVPITPPVLAQPVSPAPPAAIRPTLPITQVPVTSIPLAVPPVAVPPVSPLPVAAGTPVLVQLPGTDARLAVMRSAYASAVDRFVRPGVSTGLPVAAGLDLDGARTALLHSLLPSTTVAVLAAARVPALAALTGLTGRDPVAPVMAGPVFTEAAYTELVTASHDAFVPGLDSIPPDSVTLVQTNPTFIAAYLAGLNSALGHELLWRGYPTDERGTYWHSFWGAAADIGPLHLFSGGLADNVMEGTQPLLVLVLRGRLLRRYPDADVYAVLAGTDADVPELDDGTKITRPIFRDFVGPDITLVGFPLTYDEVVGTGSGQGYWFVVAEHPGQPRFGLTDPDPQVIHPPLPTWDELSWADLGPAAVADTYLPAAAPPMSPAGSTRSWAASAADMAAITYQPAVRVAIRARDLLASTGSAGGGTP
jgi:hypothetical protein